MSKRILILSHKPPYPKVDGGSIAMAQFLEGCLTAGHEVNYLCMRTHKHIISSSPSKEKLSFHTVFVDTRIKALPLLFNYLFSKDSYILSRFIDKSYEAKLLELLKKENYDTIVFESLFTALYTDLVSKNSLAKQIYRSHNVEYLIWEQKSQNERNYFLRKYYKHQAKRLKREEMTLWQKFKNIASISAIDTEHINKYCSAHISTLSFCHTNPKSINSLRKNKADFFHIGAMDWQPNIEAIKWLYKEIWPKFKAVNTISHLHIAGRSMPNEIKNLSINGCTIHGEVANAEDFMNEHEVMLVPLRSGSGVRIKIIEGLTLGKCIIGTDLAFKGIPIKHLSNALIANTTAEFIEVMNFCINNPKKVSLISKNARIFAEEHFSTRAFNKTLENIL